MTEISINGKRYRLEPMPPGADYCAACAFDHPDNPGEITAGCHEANKIASCTPATDGLARLDLVFKEVV